MRIVSTGYYLPKRIQLASELDDIYGQPVGWSFKNFGLKSRHIADGEETTSFMGMKACEAALAQSGWGERDVDVLIGACGVMEQPIPSTSVLIQRALGWGRSGIRSFDVNQTCLSFMAALDIAHMGMKTQRWKRALIVSSDIASAGLDNSVPATASIFGDGAGAICVENSQIDAYLASGFETYGDGADLAVIRSGGTKIRAEDGYEALLSGSKFEMDAFGVFKAAAKRLPKLMDRILADAGHTRDSIDCVICHQASAPGVEHIRRLFSENSDRVINIFATHGNQIAASIPIVLAQGYENGQVKPGMNILLLGTAAGISTGSIVLRA